MINDIQNLNENLCDEFHKSRVGKWVIGHKIFI